MLDIKQGGIGVVSTFLVAMIRRRLRLTPGSMSVLLALEDGTQVSELGQPEHSASNVASPTRQNSPVLRS